MAANDYVTRTQLRAGTPGDDDSSTDTAWDALADAVSRLFDRECEVNDGFFAADTDPAAARNFYTNGTRYLELPPYVTDSISSISIATTEYYAAAAADRTYRESDGFLILGFDVPENTIVTVTANWGFAAVSPDIQQACIEQALAMWRRKDMSFADLSGVSGAAAVAELTPTFKLVTERYRALYSMRSYFA